MKRFLTISAVFFTAIVIGLGAVIFLPPDANAGYCEKDERRVWYMCDDPLCSAPTPHGKYDCGTFYYGGGIDVCDCYFVACAPRCPQIIPLP